MKTVLSGAPWAARYLCIFAAVVGLAAGGWAQAPSTGTVSGRVFNPATKEYIGNAEVRLEGTGQTAYTESDGTFQFPHVPAGTATVTVNFIGYNSAKDTFEVTAGQTAVREINLISSAATAPSPKGEVVMLEAFTVSSEREGNAKAIQAQRRTMNITTSVSSDIFGDVADGNVGEFLKYLPGVDLDYVESEARGPRLGGMDSQYVGVSFDGMRTASADANRGGGAASRATSFESAQIVNIESIEINWTASPENDADSPAGIVNMKSKRAFDRKGREFRYNYGVNFNSGEFTLRKTPGIEDRRNDYKWKPKYELSYADTFFNRRLGILISGARSTSYTEQLSESLGYNRSATAADPRPMVIRQLDFKDGPKLIGRDTMLLTADWRATQRLTLSLNMNYNYAEGHFWNRNFTFVAANDNSNVNNGRSRVGGDGLLTVIANRAATGSVDNVATLNNGGGSSNKLTYTRQISPKFEYKAGPWSVDGAFAFSRSVNNYESLERGFSNSEGGGAASSFIATRNDPKSWEWTIRQTSGNDWFDLRSFTSTDSRSGGTRVTNDNRTWSTEKWTGLGNIAWVPPFEALPTVLKFGGKWDQELRNNNHHSDVDIWSYDGPGGNTTTRSATNGANVINSWGNWANVGPEFVSQHPFDLGTTNAFAGGGIYNINGQLGMAPRVSRNAVSDLFHNHPELFVNTSTPENYYTDYYANKRDFGQTVTAGYLQSTTKVTRELQVRVGVRMERTQNAFKEFDPLTRAQVLAAGYTANAVGTNNGRALTLPGMMYQYESQPKIKRYSQYHNYFPSILTKFTPFKNFEWQAGWNKSIGRQAIDDLTGLWVVNESNQTVTVPNPTLLPERHQKFQSRLAYYFSGGNSPGSLSVSFQSVDTTNATVSQTFSASEWFTMLGGEGDPDLEAYRFTTKLTDSLHVARTKSMDWDYRQTLGFLPSEYLRGVSLQFNYSRTYTTNVRKYSAPHRISSRVGYSYRRFSAGLGAIWVSDRPNDATYGRYFGQITKFDLTTNFRLTNHVWIYLEGRNITNVKDEWYESPPGVEEGKQGYLRGMEGYGSNWVFGVRGSF